jgi:hypothetical protein
MDALLYITSIMMTSFDTQEINTDRKVERRVHTVCITMFTVSTPDLVPVVGALTVH